MAPPKPTQPAARPTPETAEPQRPHPGDTQELATALQEAPAIQDWDVTGVVPRPGQGNQHQFFADDGDWEYKIVVSRVRKSLLA